MMLKSSISIQANSYLTYFSLCNCGNNIQIQPVKDSATISARIRISVAMTAVRPTHFHCLFGHLCVHICITLCACQDYRSSLSPVPH